MAASPTRTCAADDCDRPAAPRTPWAVPLDLCTEHESDVAEWEADRADARRCGDPDPGAHPIMLQM